MPIPLADRDLPSPMTVFQGNVCHCRHLVQVNRGLDSDSSWVDQILRGSFELDDYATQLICSGSRTFGPFGVVPPRHRRLNTEPALRSGTSDRPRKVGRLNET